MDTNALRRCCMDEKWD